MNVIIYVYGLESLLQPLKQIKIPPLVIILAIVYGEWVNLAVIGAWHLFL